MRRTNLSNSWVWDMARSRIDGIFTSHSYLHHNSYSTKLSLAIACLRANVKKSKESPTPKDRSASSRSGLAKTCRSFPLIDQVEDGLFFYAVASMLIVYGYPSHRTHRAFVGFLLRARPVKDGTHSIQGDADARSRSLVYLCTSCFEHGP